MSIKVVTDSTSYIPEDIIKKYDISIVSLHVNFEDECVREIDIDNATFYDKLEKCVKLPTSSQPNIKELYDIFEGFVKEEKAVVGIFISSKMSGTYSGANLVKEMILQKYPKAEIELIDSMSNCMQMGYAAIAAAKAAFEGENINSVIKAAYNVIGKSKFYFIPETLDYLRKGGRIGGAAALFGNLLKIKPILTVTDGSTAVYDKVRTTKRAIDRIINIFTEDISKKGLEEVMIHCINCEKQGAELEKKIEEITGRSVRVCPLGPVIGLHVGPGTVAIVYYTKE